MYYSANPVVDYEMYSATIEKALSKLPRCSICGEPIQGEYYWDIGGEYYCEDCLRDCRRDTDEYE